MTKLQYLAIHRKLCDDARKLSKQKNADYAGASDPFRNFRKCEELGICSLEAGIMVRLSDKISRLATLLTKDPSVVTESFNDTVVDGINYLCILAAARAANNEEIGSTQVRLKTTPRNKPAPRTKRARKAKPAANAVRKAKPAKKRARGR